MFIDDTSTIKMYETYQNQQKNSITDKFQLIISKKTLKPSKCVEKLNNRQKNVQNINFSTNFIHNPHIFAWELTYHIKMIKIYQIWMKTSKLYEKQSQTWKLVPSQSIMVKKHSGQRKHMKNKVELSRAKSSQVEPSRAKSSQVEH